MKRKTAMLVLLLAGPVATALSAIIGTNVPSLPLTAERVADLPAWKTYYENSQRQRQADQEFLGAELRALGLQQPIFPPSGVRAKNEELDNPPDWYAGSEAHRIAEAIVSFQTPAGGWSMNTDFTKSPRLPGEMFSARGRTAGTNGLTGPLAADWSFVGTFENNGTTTELRFLAKVITAAKADGEPWKKSFFRGLDYLFAAQYPNGGWPQVWPLQGSYHDAITFNNNALPHILSLLLDVADGQNDFAFVPPALRARARASMQRGIECVLAAQVRVNGTRTAWCQQQDALTLAPAPGRSYEMPALAASESAAVVDFLMLLPQPDTNVVAAVHAACAWFKKTEIAAENYAYEPAGPGDGDAGSRKLVAVPGSSHRWPRACQIGTNKPLFGDRDQTIHDSINDLSKDRRTGYAWFRDTPQQTLEHYAKWAAAHPQ